MITAEESLSAKIQRYVTDYPDESVFIHKFQVLLEHADAFQRTHLPGHITASAFIVSEDMTQILLVHHAKLNKWLQPGGHADGDTHVTRVALREGNEETGLQHLQLTTADIFDLDIHPIPARKDLQEHDHYDVRFLVIASVQEKIIVSEESHDVKWVPVAELEKYNDEKSILRMKAKLLQQIATRNK